MTIKGITIPLNDLLSVAIGVVGLLAAWLQRKNKLPKWAAKWLNKIELARILRIIEDVNSYRELSEEGKRKRAVEILKQITERELGGDIIPDSIANLLVEYAFQLWKNGRRG